MTAPGFKTIQFAPNVTIFREGDKADCAYIIKKGSVKITKRSPNGTTIPIALVESGGIVGEMAIVTQAPRSATVVTQGAVEALAVSKESFDNRLKEIDPFLYSLIKTVIGRLRKTSSHTAALYEKAKAGKDIPVKSKPKRVNNNLNKASFSNVKFMLADPNSQTRNSLRGGLFGFGFREISDVSTFEQVCENIEKESYDLLVLDTAFGVNRVSELIQDIRHGKKCKNPFMSIMVLSENNKNSFLQSLLHAGGDMAVPKPVSIKDVTEAIKDMCTRRQPFVVTRNYVGPDRATFKSDLGEDAPFFKPPNSLAAKVFGGLGEEEIQDRIQQGLIDFNELKMERHLVQLAWLLDRLDPDKGEPLDLTFILDQVDVVLEDLLDRSHNSQYTSSSETCRNMRNLVLNLKEESAPQDVQWTGMNTCYQELLETMPLIQAQNSPQQLQNLRVVN